MAPKARVQKRLYYKIGEACKALGIQPYVLRYWETEFPALNPSKSRSGQRVYSEKEIEVIRRIKELLYDEGYTIAGAKKKLEAELASGSLGEPGLFAAELRLPSAPSGVASAALGATAAAVAAEGTASSAPGEASSAKPPGETTSAAAPDAATSAPGPGALTAVPSPDALAAASPGAAAASPRPARATAPAAGRGSPTSIPSTSPAAVPAPAVVTSPATSAAAPGSSRTLPAPSRRPPAPQVPGDSSAASTSEPGFAGSSLASLAEPAPDPAPATILPTAVARPPETVPATPRRLAAGGASAPDAALDTAAAQQIQRLRSGIQKALQEAREILALLESPSP